MPSSTLSVNIETQSSVRQAGTTPRVIRARGRLDPNDALKPAGILPEPPCPSENDTWPLATATAEPELEPPEI